jgi:DNA (cytosine-5)-methyltransferase 1
MAVKFGSVCSGIEAASVAWNGLGWEASWVAEVDAFPSAVLAHHYPNVPNLGDMRKLPTMILNREIHAPEVFCGGTPCQAFSVAGKRQSLDDERGNLTLTFCEIADALDTVRKENRKHPTTIFWENVAGILSTHDGAFGCFLAALAGEVEPLQPTGSKWTNAGLVFGPKRAVAWRVLDAQYFGLAQRRKRLYVVASARKTVSPVEILFEFDRLSGNLTQGNRTRKTVTPTTRGSTATGNRKSGPWFDIGSE